MGTLVIALTAAGALGTAAVASASLLPGPLTASSSVAPSRLAGAQATGTSAPTSAPTPAPAVSPPAATATPRTPATATPIASPTSATSSSGSQVSRKPEPAKPVASSFVTASGANLMLNGHVWQFAGYNDYRLTSMPNALDCGGVTTDSDLSAMLSEIHTNSGATVVRTWFNQSFGGPGNWAAFDRVLNAAAALGMKVIPTLTDQWSACEPSFPSTHYRPITWYQSGYTSPDSGYTLSFRDFAVAMARQYANNPTIAFWQLVNEPEAKDSINGTCEEQAATNALRSFFDDVIGAMKAVDSNHLVDPGSMGGGQCGMQGTDYVYVHSGLADICELHDYTGPGALPGDQWNGVAVRISECKAMGKPIYEGEVGVDATSIGLLARAQAYADKMNAQFPLGLAGFMVWEWAPPGTPSQAYEVAPGDPLEAMMQSIVAALDRTNGT